MSKSNFLLIDLNETKTKKISEIIASNTSRKILDSLAEKEDTEQNIAKNLDLPISTVHYHLQKLVESGLVVIDEFHYSKKGREINHYKLANKYIIIAPKKVSGLRQKLKGILPIAGIVLGISAVVEITNRLLNMPSPPLVARPQDMTEALPLLAKSGTVVEPLTRTFAPHSSAAVWFLIGGIASLLIYLIVAAIKEFNSRKK